MFLGPPKNEFWDWGRWRRISVPTRPQTGALRETHDAVQCGARTGNSAAHTGFQYCRQDGRSAPPLSDHSTAHNLSDCRQCSFIVRCVLSYSYRHIPSDCTIDQVARRICCLPQWNSELAVQPSVAVTAQRTSRYCSLHAMNTLYEFR